MKPAAPETPGEIDVEQDAATGRERADDLMAERGAKMREEILGSPLGTLEKSDHEHWARLCGQLKLLATNRSEDLRDAEPVARELAEIILGEGGDRSWLDELMKEAASELAREATLHVLREHVRGELAEAAVGALAQVFAIPTAPAAVVLLLARMLIKAASETER